MSHNLLTKAILAGIVLGILVGWLSYDANWSSAKPLADHSSAVLLSACHFLGVDLFMGLLKLLIMPLVATSVIVAVTSLDDVRQLGRLSIWTIAYYVGTMFLAVCLGLLLVSALVPGSGAGDLPLGGATAQFDSEAIAAHAEGGVFGAFSHLLQLMLPQNIFQALSEGSTLSVIVFSLFFGIVAASLGEKTRAITELAASLFQVFMRMVEVVLWLAPIGVFALIVLSVAQTGATAFASSLGAYAFTVTLGLLLHAFVLLPLVLWLFTKSNPFVFLWAMREAVLTAFSTASSSATLPVTIDCATTNANVRQDAAGLVLPLGSTINMDGTALYEAVAVVFLAQVYGIELATGQLILIAFTATLAAIGAAGIPSAGLVTMVIVVEATNNSLAAAGVTESIPLAGIGLIVGIDRILDMFRTAVNVWGDSVGAKIISDKLEAERQTNN